MENIILIGHGSPKREANNLEIIGRLLHRLIHAGCNNNCVKVAYLQFGEPGLLDAIRQCVLEGARRIIIHPYFLNRGIHVTKDIPEIIEEAKRLYPDREFLCTEPLGIHEKLVHVIVERLREATGLKPEDIEKRSFGMISEEIDLNGIPSEQLPIIKRVIHATADFEFKDTLLFHPDAIKTGIDLIRTGKDILTDVEMVKTGIIKRWLEPFGGKVICRINDEDVVRLSKATGKTRSEIAIEKALQEKNNIGIIAIGNAPTALLKVIEIFRGFTGEFVRIPPCRNSSLHQPTHSPVLVIGVPVGFVRALESKMLLATQRFPFITNLSRKGGTPVAVAIVNALLKMSKEERL